MDYLSVLLLLWERTTRDERVSNLLSTNHRAATHAEAFETLLARGIVSDLSLTCMIIMSGFKAFNLESDDESDVEVDDTKELQIEEALKLYQTALRHHSEGPGSFDEAADAYQLLFESEIFQYPESQAELRRIELYGAAPETEGLWNDDLPQDVILTSSLVTGPSTLPQILHLAHKNYAQFKLEVLTARLDDVNVTLQQILAEASTALTNFVQALDKDDTDLDLWRRTASVGEMVDSKRIARFCLESVLDGDDEGLKGALSLPGLDESLASEQLHNLIAQLQDHLSSLQSPLSAGKRRILSKLLKRQLEPYKHILQQETILRNEGQTVQQPRRPERQFLKAPKTWAGLGQALLVRHLAEQDGKSSASPSMAIAFDTEDTQAQPATAMDIQGSPRSAAPLPPQTAAEDLISDQTLELTNEVPAAQPPAASADVTMEDAATIPVEDTLGTEAPTTTTLPSRKRSIDAAGLQDGTDESRAKGRRTRARESNVDNQDSKQAMRDANDRWESEQKLREVEAADDWMFETVGNLFEKAGIVGIGAARNVRQEAQSPNGSTPPAGQTNPLNALRLARNEIRAFLDHYSDEQAQLLLHGGEDFDLDPSSSASGLGSIFPNSASAKTKPLPISMPNEGLPELLQMANENEMFTQDVVWAFVEALMKPGRLIPGVNSYTAYKWSDHLKTMLVRILVNFDVSLLEKAAAELGALETSVETNQSEGEVDALAGLIQAVFELHLDIYCLIKDPNSGVAEETTLAQGDRLRRWACIAQGIMQLRSLRSVSPGAEDELGLRFLWTVAFHIGAAPNVTQEHVIECMKDLRTILLSAGELTIDLQNNAVIPEISLAVLDGEITKITTKDFFLKVTSQDLGDPVADIETLEPLLEAVDAANASSEADDRVVNGAAFAVDSSAQLVHFLIHSGTSVTLLLWQRLRRAYHDIDYPPMMVRCYFRMLRLVLDELKSLDATSMGETERQATVLKSVRLMHVMIEHLFDLVQHHAEALQCIDEDRLQLAVNALGEVLQLVQVFNIAEDHIRLDLTQAPTLPSGDSIPSFERVSTTIHEMQLRIWMILYALLQDAIAQNAELYPTPDEDRFDFLRVVHRNLGLRETCGALNRVFVRMLKTEFFQLAHVDGYESEQAQVLHDLYGLNCFLNPSWELGEHHCIYDAFLDRTAAMQTLDLLLAQASKLPIKELIKHPLKDTIEKVHGVIKKKPPSEAIIRNREIYRAFMRSPINPLDLYSCVKGHGNELPVSIIPSEDAPLASRGWYFLLGNMALTKFRSQKRLAQTATEDVDTAIAFFMQDLEASGERWETWFRLAQAFDTKIEENVVWSAEKLNNSMQELIIPLQRSAIHCYTMATALAMRAADPTTETLGKMTEMYGDFAMRLYSTSREPFSMLPFSTDETERYLNSAISGVIKGKAFQPASVYTVWKLAKVFFKRAIDGTPESWQLHYMVGKCLWKMHSLPAHLRRQQEVTPSGTQMLEAFTRALELVPGKDRKESRDSKREPVLEPHYKLATIVHKLVMLGSISLEEAKEALDHTQYAPSESFPSDRSDWIPYILRVLKNLRVADKSNWYHRIIARTAQILYDNPPLDGTGPPAHQGAVAAKEQLMQQMFTKTMVLQVWRPETERAGRHFVYTARYTRFCVRILQQLDDRTNLEQLARRTRRRTQEIFKHGAIWEETCVAYLQLLRASADLAEGLETSTFSNIVYEDFLARKKPLEDWMQAQDPGESPALDCLRENQEFKKLNQSLMKTGAIDDLIGDSYAYLFNTVGRQLWDEHLRAQQEEQAKPVPSPSRHPVMNLNHLMNLDGTTDKHSAPAAVEPLPPASKAPNRRKPGVGRKEIRTAAESCYQKLNATSAKESISTTVRPVQVLISTHRRTGLPGDSSVDTSAPGSLHDSADESELSELEEEDEDEGSEEEDQEAELEPEPVTGAAEPADQEMMDAPGHMERSISPSSRGFIAE